MQDTARQAPVAIVGAVECKVPLLQRAEPGEERAGTARHAEATPDLGLVRTIHHHRVVRRRAPQLRAQRRHLVIVGAAVHHHALPVEAELVAEHVRVGVARLVIRPARPAVDEQALPARAIAVVAGVGPADAAWRGRGGAGRVGRQAEDTRAVIEQRRRCRRDTEGRVVEQRDVVIAGEDVGEVMPGPRRRCAQRQAISLAGQSRIRLEQVHHVEDVLEHDAVVHRAALVMPAVGEQLPGALLHHQRHATRKPARRRRAGEERTAEHQRLRVLQQVVRAEMKLQVALEPGELQREAREPRRLRLQAPGEGLDPVHRAQRDRVGLPGIHAPRRVARDPAPDQRRPLRRREARCAQVIHVVQVVAPELRLAAAAPVDRIQRQAMGVVEEGEVAGQPAALHHGREEGCPVRMEGRQAESPGRARRQLGQDPPAQQPGELAESQPAQGVGISCCRSTDAHAIEPQPDHAPPTGCLMCGLTGAASPLATCRNHNSSHSTSQSRV